MLSRNQAKHIQSLKLAKFRKLHQQFIAEGIKLAEEILNSSFEVAEAFAMKEWIETNLALLQAKNIPFHVVDEKELARISQLVTPNEVLLVLRMPDDSSVEILSDDIILLLDRIQDPGNLGTIMRTADWFGIRTIVCSPGCADIYNPKVVQSTMGSITRVRVLEREPVELLNEMVKDAMVYGTMMEGENLYEAELKTPAIIVIGNESKGISGELVPMLSRKIGIPEWSDKVESLNASVATGIILSEFRRRLG